MNENDQHVDQLLAEFWREGGSNVDMVQEVRGVALANPSLTIAIVAARALTAICTVKQPPSWEERVGRFKVHVAQLIDRCHQVDKLGDPETDPAAIFEILGDESLVIDAKSFDADKLRQARVSRSRPDAAREFLRELGRAALDPDVRDQLDGAAASLSERARRYQCHALFEAKGEGIALGVQVHEESDERIEGFNAADSHMKRQAEVVLGHFLNQGARWGLEWDLPYGGSSIGLALAIAALVARGKALADPLLAATGRIDANWNVCSVESVPEKVRGAAAAGFRRILVPRANEKEAREAAGDLAWLDVIAVERLDQLEAKLRGLSGAVPVGSDGSIRYIRKLAPLYELDVAREETLQNGFRLGLADASSEAFVDVFSGGGGTVTVGGKGSAKATAERLVADHLPTSKVEARPSMTVLIASPTRREQLETSLMDRGAVAAPSSQYEVWRYQLGVGASKATAILYSSNKCVIQGSAPAYDEVTKLVGVALEGLGGLPSTNREATEEAQSQPRPDSDLPHIGTDEAGKGDYFGPLVCAAVFVDARITERLRALGVRDSKTLTDKAIHRLAEEIRSLGRMWAVTTIQPSRYNSLYSEMRREGKNLNTLVAWGHARSIEDLLGRGIEAEYAVIDKFADERYLRAKVLAGTRRSGMRFDHRVRGESDIAVAAASILAREAFVRWLADRSKMLGLALPKGASQQVIDAGRRIVTEKGKAALGELAKLSFKTTQAVLGGKDD